MIVCAKRNKTLCEWLSIRLLLTTTLDEQRLLQYSHCSHWLMLSDCTSCCCIFAAKIGAILLCWVLADAFRFSTKLLYLRSKDQCNATLLSTGWCFQILRAAASFQQRLVQCYYVEYWLMILSDSASCCMVAAKMVQYASVDYWLILLDSLSCNFATRFHAMLCWVLVVA